MYRKTIWTILSMLLIAAFVLTACTPQATATTAPAEATPQLDLAAIAAKTGDHAKAAEIARSVVRWRDTAGESVDPSQRHDAILRTHRWLERAS